MDFGEAKTRLFAQRESRARPETIEIRDGFRMRYFD